MSILSVVFQEAVLGFPHRYLQRLGDLPQTPRPLTPVQPAKKKSYLQLASALLSKQPTEATRRAVVFILKICNDLTPEPTPTLKWLEGRPEIPCIQTGLPSFLPRVAPVMAFRAHVRP